MKSKSEEMKQFRNFLGRIEKGGYLDGMFGNLLFYVERQIADDMGTDINDIIQGFYNTAGEVRQLRERIKEQVEMKEDFQKDAESLQIKLSKANAERERLEAELDRAHRDYEGIMNRNTDLQELAEQKIAQVQELQAKADSTTNRNEKLQEEIVRLKGKLYDYFEEIQELKKKLGINQS